MATEKSRPGDAIRLTKRKPELKPGDEYNFIGIDWCNYVTRECQSELVVPGVQFTTERGTFEITKITDNCITTKFISPETEKGPTGDVRV